MSIKRDDKRLQEGFRSLFANFFGMISGDPYLLVQIELDNCDISSPKGKAVYFSNDVTQEQRNRYFTEHPDHVSFWSTEAGQRLKDMMTHFKPNGKDKSAIPDFSFDDFKKLKTYLLGKFARHAEGSFHLVCNMHSQLDSDLREVLTALEDNDDVTIINGQNKTSALKSLQNKMNREERTETKVVCLKSWSEKKRQPQ